MSQVLAAKAAQAAVPSAREASASNRKGELFAALFERMKSSRRERQTPAGAGRATSQGRLESAPELPGEGSAARRARAQRSQESARQTGPAEPGAKRQSVSDDEVPQDVASQPASPEQTAGQDIPPAGKDPQESSCHEPEQQYGQQEPVAPETQAGTGFGELATDDAQTSSAGISGQGIPVGSAALPAGSSQHLCGGPVPMPAEAPGSPSGAGPVTPQAVGPWGLQPTAEMPLTGAGSQAESPELPGEALEAEGKSPAGAQPQGKASEAGENFQAMLAHAGRGRGIAQSHRAGMTPAGGTIDSVDKPIEVNGPAGTEELARVVRAKFGARHSAMMIQLDPPELGRVRVDVKMHQDVLTLRFQAETEAGHDALAGRIRELTGALEGQGIRLDRVEVEYRPPADGQRDGQSSQQQGGQEWKDPRYAGEKRQSGAQRESAFSHPPGADGFPSAAGSQDRANSSLASGVDVVI